MKLIFLLRKWNAPVPEKNKQIQIHSARPLGKTTAMAIALSNEMHDLWANIEVPEVKTLDRDKLDAICSKYLTIEVPRELKLKFNDYEKMLDAICSLALPQLPTEEELEKVIEKNKWMVAKKAMSGEQPLTSSKDLAKAILATIRKGER